MGPPMYGNSPEQAQVLGMDGFIRVSQNAGQDKVPLAFCVVLALVGGWSRVQGLT